MLLFFNTYFQNALKQVLADVYHGMLRRWYYQYSYHLPWSFLWKYNKQLLSISIINICLSASFNVSNHLYTDNIIFCYSMNSNNDISVILKPFHLEVFFFFMIKHIAGILCLDEIDSKLFVDLVCNFCTFSKL